MAFSLRSILVGACLGASLLAPAQAALVLDLNTGGSAASCNACGTSGTTFGWSFRVSSAIKIDGLGVWDADANGLGQASVQIGLWTDTGTLLASTAVTDSSDQVASASANGTWLFEDIAELTLGAGSYRIGALFFNSTPLAQTNAPYTSIAEVSLTGGIQNQTNSGFGAPLSSFSIPIFGPTMRLADGNQVPEPVTLALGTAGLLSLAMVRRRNRK